MLQDVVPRRRHKLRELLDWIKEERGISASQLAERSGAFVRAAITYQLNKERPNPELDMIHGIAKVAGIPEQLVVDACLGRPLKSKRELESEALRELLRKYEMIRAENRPESLDVTLTILTNLVEETLEAQEQRNARR